MTDIELSVRTIHTGEQCVPALCERVPGADRVACLYGNHVEGIHRAVIPLREHDQSSLATYVGQPYPVTRLTEKLKEIALTRGIAPDAQEMAVRLLPGVVPVEQGALPGTVMTPELAISASPAALGAKSVLGSVCTQLKMEPSEARKRLRAAGMSAPYINAALIFKVLSK